MPIHVNYFPLPTQLLAVFERKSSKDEVRQMSCPVVALTLNELGELSSMCAVPQNDQFVPVELAHQHLHRTQGGLFTFSHYEYQDALGKKVRWATLPHNAQDALENGADETHPAEQTCAETNRASCEADTIKRETVDELA